MTAWILLALVAAPALHAEDQAPGAPLGLSWGMTLARAEKMLNEIAERREQGNFTVLYALRTPKMLDGTDFVELLFDREKGLVKVVWVGQRVTSDSVGLEGRRRFQYLYELLLDKYGAPAAESRAIAQKIYVAPDEFYECLAYTIGPCGLWAAGWQNSAYGAVSLKLEGVGKGEGYIELTYESPAWIGISTQRNSAAARKDKDAL